MGDVKELRDEYWLLSNFADIPVYFNGILYRNSEAAFQSQKTFDMKLRLQFASVDPDTAKHMGRKLKIRPDWDTARLWIMRDIVAAKVQQNRRVKDVLLNIDGTIEEGNTWHDKFWGVDLETGEGENHLGKILMEIRDEMKGLK